MTPIEFKRIRKAARMTQAQMAERLGVSRKTIVNWEAGIFNIPDDALDTLTERGVAPTPAESKPVCAGTHPEMYGPGKLPNSFRRNEKHPHWFTQCTGLRYYLSKAQKDMFDAMVAYPDDVEKLQWTPAKAIAFMENLGLSKSQALDIARDVGFDVPAKTETAFNIVHNDWLTRYGSLKGFYEAYPQFTPPETEQTPEQIEDSKRLQADLDAAFNLTKNPGE